MWERVDAKLPEDVARVTISVWEYPGIMRVGLMRPSMLAPPLVWGEPIKTGFRNLKLAPDLVTDLQLLLHSPIFYAEAETTKLRNQALLLYLGFVELQEEAGRKLYQRSI